MELLKEIKEFAPWEYQDQLEVLRDAGVFLETDIINLEILCGNLYNNQHDRWTLFVKFANKVLQAKSLIKKVSYRFSDGERVETVQRPFFTMKGRGNRCNN